MKHFYNKRFFTIGGWFTWAAIVVGTVAAGTAAYSANQQNKNSKKAAGAIAQNQVAPPNYNDAYKSGVANQYAWAPMFAQQEQDLRARFAPQQAQLAGDIYGPLLQRMAGSNMRTLRTIDPESIEGRKQLYGNVSGDLRLGTQISPELLAQTQQDIRGAQTARGNFLGNAPITAEAAFDARTRENMYQQRIANMMNFLRGPTPQDHFGKLAGAGGAALGMVTGGAASPGYQYVQPPTNVGQQFVNNAALRFEGASANGQQLGQAQASAAMQQQNPWAAALAAGLGAGTQAYNSGAFSQQQKPATYATNPDWRTSARGAAGRA